MTTSRSLSTTFTIFGEDGSAATEIARGLSGLADVRVGYHVHPKVAIAVALTINGTTPTIVSVNESGNGWGGNVGADLSTFFSERYGLGVFVRYAAATVDLPSASGVSVGGIQAGAGPRLRF